MEDLKNCPFCGKNKIQIIKNTWSIFIVECDDCGSTSGESNDRDKSIEKWNTRHSPWISISEKLPENNNLVFAYQEFEEKNLNKVRIMNYQFETWKGPGFGNVTHWMPIELPQTPKETE